VEVVLSRILAGRIGLPSVILAAFAIPMPAIGQIPLSTSQIAKKVSPSVVVIQGKTDSGSTLGSGFIISKEGQIVTDLHVIRDLKSESVQMADGHVFDFFTVLGVDERRDLAIIRIGNHQAISVDPSDVLEPDPCPERTTRPLPPDPVFPALALANSDSLAIGEPVVIVGSPQGLEGTVTSGILSSIREGGEGYKVLQTDAAVNPGNSGGPIANNRGQVIGVVAFKLRSTEGLNFGVPIRYVRELLNHLHEPITLEAMQRRMAPKAAPAQTTFTLAGVELHIGMTQERVLSKFVGLPGVKVSQMQNGSYTVSVRDDPMDVAGNLTFGAGALIRVEISDFASVDGSAMRLFKAIYAAVQAGEAGGIVGVWTSRNENVSAPMYNVHVVFKDREVVVSGLTFQGSEQTDVHTYFPRLLVPEGAGQ
jgi:S1-C subfamily serine protease